MSLNWAAAFVAILYYLTVIFVGVWAGRKVHIHDSSERRRRSSAKQGTPTSPQLSISAGDQYVRNLLVANRSLPLVLSCGSMTATWVGGGYLNATAEAVFQHGLLHTYAPFGYTLSLLLGGLFFAGRMRLSDAMTMLDPFQKHYGRWMGLLLALPAVGSEVLWSGAILSALENRKRERPKSDTFVKFP
ncbi:high-affinity choline transporter 1-like [Dermacentor silvarum]|uniref:high-affinity choline transporter 1-like n=1 Tax=Dermacentor silvarum TaxID=543639 RepID=UPI00189BD312|nr:high-affinity choline transporter 1-like [Dermacentor silvarum]